uniref:DUF4371 domain-containing protein n=1 Tax=Latimeria chalumnae TaxID=7897 RepID=H3AUA6_LATCH
KWLMYSETKKATFCFLCMLFAKKSSTTPSLANPKKGFCDWKHLNPRIPDHENSPEHHKFEMCLKKGGAKCAIDDELQTSISSEKENWRSILKIVVDVVLFWGSTDVIGHPKSRIFLNLLELISNYNSQLASHIASHKKGSTTYFSPTVPNEFINLLGSTVRCEILSTIKQAKYFSMLFDCTPGVAHKEQMCQIIRYVRIAYNDCSVEESFIDFINTSEKTGSGLAAEIEKKLCNDSLNIADCHGQGYDNGANMACKYCGVQARLAQVNELARFVPCTAHSLNLVGVHAASVSVDMVSFF